MENNFFGLLSRMKYINRWGLMRNTHNENLSEHSLDVAIIAHCLATIRNVRLGGNVNAERVAVLAMFHDSHEIITGDMPTPIKYYNSKISEAYKEIESVAAEKMLSFLPDDLKSIYLSLISPHEDEKELWEIVGAADKLSALTKCIQERRMGNDDFADAETSTLKKLKALKSAEVDIFINEFLGSYNLTLDEQTSV